MAAAAFAPPQSPACSKHARAAGGGGASRFGSAALSACEVGIGVRKGDAELLGKINTSLAKLKANGTVEKILAKWGLKAQGV